MSSKPPFDWSLRHEVEWIPWRGSVGDLVTDIVCALPDEQLDQLIEALQKVDRPRKRRDSGMHKL